MSEIVPVQGVKINVGRTERNFDNVGKIVTNTASGTMTWVPESAEITEDNLTETSITQNGYYEPEAGTYWNGVTVAVTGNQGEVTLTENGDYAASEQGFDGFGVVHVQVPEKGTESLRFFDKGDISYYYKTFDLNEMGFSFMEYDGGE